MFTFQDEVSYVKLFRGIIKASFLSEETQNDDNNMSLEFLLHEHFFLNFGILK